MKDYDITSQADLERLARRRANAKLGFYIHAAVYVAVNFMLGLMAIAAGRNWAVYPALGWGMGLAIHGAVVFLMNGSTLHQRMIQQERQRLTLQRDPW